MALLIGGLTLTLLGFPFRLGVAQEQPAIKLAYVDVQKAVSLSEAGKEAFQTLKQEFERRRTVIQAQEEDLKRLQTELTQQAMVLNRESRRAKEDEYRRRLREYKGYISESEQEMKVQEQELTNEILASMFDILQDMGSEGNYTFIMEKTQGVIYAESSIDLTDELIRRYDTVYGGKTSSSAADGS